MAHSLHDGLPSAASPFSTLGPQQPGREAVDSFIRSYQTLLRSTGEVRLAGLVVRWFEPGGAAVYRKKISSAS